MPNTEKEIRNDPSTVTTHTNQMPGNKTAKGKNDIYSENFKTPKKETEEDTRR